MLKHVTSSESWQKKNLGAKGFTLIELLVVIVILGVLAAVVVFAVTGITNNSEDSACEIELRTVRTATQAYNAEEGSFPADVATLETAGFLDDGDTAGAYTINGTTGAVTQTSCDP